LFYRTKSAINYLPFGLGAGGLLPLPPPDGLPVVLGALGGLVVPFAIVFSFKILDLVSKCQGSAEISEKEMLCKWDKILCN